MANGMQKWDIWLKPNQMVTEEYPYGFSKADVESAAQARWGSDKVMTVSPTPLKSGDPDTWGSRGGGGGSAGGFFEMLGGCAFWLIAAVVLVSWLGGGNDDKGAPEPSRVSSERVQKQPNPRFTQPAPQSFETVQKRVDVEPVKWAVEPFSGKPPVAPVAPTPARSQCIKLC